MKSVKYGMIGAGMMAGGHVKCMERIKGIDLVAVSDPHAESLERFREAHGFAGVREFADHRELLEKTDVDAVVISAPDFLHVDLTLDALAAGKDVLCEKPAATTRADLARLEAAVEASDAIYQVGLECRHLRVCRALKDELASGRIGPTQMVWCKEFRGPFLRKVGQWMQFQDKTGGVFVSKTCHFFDLMTWFADARPVRVNAVAGQNVVREVYGVKPDVFDNGWVVIEYENGARAGLALCMFDHSSPGLEIGVHGSRGKAVSMIDEHRIELWEYALDEERPNEKSAIRDNVATVLTCPPSAEVGRLSHSGGVYYEHLDFLRNVRERRRPLTDIEVARWSTLVGIAAEESARKNGAPVEF